MFANLTGWHLLIILVVLAIPVGIVLLVILLARRASPQAAASPASQPAVPRGSASERLAELDRLHAAAQITDAEYAEKRAQILREL